MRKQVSLLAEFLGAAKDLTNEYSQLAEITEDEKNQIGHALMSRPDRKATAQLLSAKGVSIREIAAITGWSKSVIAEDLAVQNRTESVQNRTDEDEQDDPPEIIIEAAAIEAPPPVETFETIVLDPPWPMAKIERDVRPNQVIFDYPTMSEDELRAFRDELNKMAADDCHLFMWTTQKFLPLALDLIEHYGFRYVLTMVWHKAGGYQPTGLPQFNCEFVVYARKGTPKFLTTQGFPCCFNGPRREHSRKPDEFYEIIRLVTGGSRIDVFSREPREGFAQYGNETAKFVGAAE
jgi:N6-adenosine-specific RNA methylase IME4